MKNDLVKRTFMFAINVLDIVEMLPKKHIYNVVMNQLAKSGTSVGANYRASQRARSDREFVAKLHIVLEEVDETNYWLEIIKYRMWLKDEVVDVLIKESKELTAIIITIIKNTKDRINNKK